MTCEAATAVTPEKEDQAYVWGWQWGWQWGEREIKKYFRDNQSSSSRNQQG